MLHWVLPPANCVAEHACLFFAGHAYTSKVAFASMSLQVSFPHRASWKYSSASQQIYFILQSPFHCFGSPVHLHIAGHHLSQTPLHLQRFSCNYGPFALPQEEQSCSHPYGRNPLPHHITGRSILIWGIRMSLSSPHPSHLPGTCRGQHQTMTRIYFFHHSWRRNSLWKCPRFPQEYFFWLMLCAGGTAAGDRRWEMQTKVTAVGSPGELGEVGLILVSCSCAEYPCCVLLHW